MKLAIVKDKGNVEYFFNKQVVFFCLTLESFHFAKKTNKKVLYPFQFSQLHKKQYYEDAQKISISYIDNFYKSLSLNQDEKNFVMSRIITFFAMTLFDFYLVKEIIKKYKNYEIFCFHESKKSIVKGKWNPNSGFYYFIEILKYFCSKNKVKFKTYKNEIDESRNLNKSIGKKFAFINFKLNAIEIFKDLMYFLKSSSKDEIHVNGLRIEEKELFKNLNLKEIDVINFTGSKIFKIISRVICFFVYINKGFDNKNQKVDLKVSHTIEKFMYENRKIFSGEFLDIKKFIFSYLLEKKLYSYFLKKKPPLGVVSQNNSTLILAANLLKIKTFHISHGIIVTPELSPMLGQYNFLSCKAQVNYHLSRGLVHNNIVEIPPLHLSTESDIKMKPIKNKQYDMIILAKNMGMRRWEFDNYEEYFFICKKIVQITKKYNSQLLIKIHPSGGKHMLNIYKSLKYFNEPHVNLSYENDYLSQLKKSSIVVAFQETSAIFQAICKEKLVLFPTSHFSEPYKNNFMMNYLSSNLTSFKNGNELKDTLECIFNSSKNYDSLLEKQNSTFKTSILCASKCEISNKISQHVISNIYN